MTASGPSLARRLALSLGRMALLLAVALVVIRQVSPRFRANTDIVGAALTADRLDGIGSEMPLQQKVMMNWYLGEIADEVGVDIHIVFTDLHGKRTVEDFAAQAASRRGIGRDRAMRGLLVVYDRSSARMRMELGYGLEGYFSDAFVGRLIEDHASTFFRSGDVSTGVRLLVRIIHERIRDELVGGTFDPAPFRSGLGEFVSGGAGATAAALLGNEGALAFPVERTSDRAIGPQPTPAEAHQRMLEWLRRGRRDPWIELFTPESREYLAALPLSGPYLDHMLAGMWNETFEVVERGHWALLYYTSTPLRSPLYMKRGDDGWQIDIVQEVIATVEAIGHDYTWSFTGRGAAFEVFRDEFVWLGNFVRVRNGDNRPLPRVG